ncbi:MAG TPA: flavodoxin family protein [Firmicutes bacterium]|nr:flavodoxin family protein [Bacillota bacterium]
MIPLIFSTITGNAFKLAAAAAEAVPDHCGPYNIRYITDEVVDMFDTFIISYWCNHGTADDDTIALLSRMKDKNIIIIGTLGAARDSKHGEDVFRNVNELVSKQNRLVGHYLCRGSIDLKRTARKLRIPEGVKGHLSPERFERQKESLGHPDSAELEGVKTAVAGFLAQLEQANPVNPNSNNATCGCTNCKHTNSDQAAKA